MELIDRYLQAVEFALPTGQKDDIIKELRDSILSQIEEKESALGRPLNQDEQIDLLKQLGSPMQLAGRYIKQRGLIGAAWMPIYWKVLTIALGVAFLVHAGASIGMAAAGKTLTESLGVLFRYPGAAVMVFTWVTLVFAAMDHFGAKFKFTETWDPRTLPPLVKAPPQKSRFELTAQFTAQTIFGVWWLAGLHYQYLILGPGYAFLRFGPVWQRIYPLFVIMLVIDLTLTAVRIARPQWRDGGRASRVIMSALGLVVLYFLIQSSEPFIAADLNSEQFVALAKTVNFGLHIGLTVAVIVNIFNVAKEGVLFLWRKVDQTHHAVVTL